jgi:hypothetical protein
MVLNMKNIIIIILLFAAIGSKAQTTKIKSFEGDSIYIQKGARNISKIVVSNDRDTARSILYRFYPSRDTTSFMNVEIQFFDKTGSYINSNALPFSDPLFTHWSLLINRLDIYIGNQRPRIVLH